MPEQLQQDDQIQPRQNHGFYLLCHMEGQLLQHVQPNEIPLLIFSYQRHKIAKINDFFIKYQEKSINSIHYNFLQGPLSTQWGHEGNL